MQPVKVNILDKEFLIACPEEERAGLLESAAFLSDQMREIRDTGKVVGMDRIAVMAALNITHEMLQARNGSQGVDGAIRDRLRSIDEKINTVLKD